MAAKASAATMAPSAVAEALYATLSNGWRCVRQAITSPVAAATTTPRGPTAKRASTRMASTNVKVQAERPSSRCIGMRPTNANAAANAATCVGVPMPAAFARPKLTRAATSATWAAMRSTTRRLP